MPGRSRSERSRRLDVQEAVLHKLGIPGWRLAARPGMTDVEASSQCVVRRACKASHVLPKRMTSSQLPVPAAVATEASSHAMDAHDRDD